MVSFEFPKGLKDLSFDKHQRFKINLILKTEKLISGDNDEQFPEEVQLSTLEDISVFENPNARIKSTRTRWANLSPVTTSRRRFLPIKN